MAVQSDFPEVGRLYRHFKGGFYTVVDLCMDADTSEDIVVYVDMTGVRWSRMVIDWLRESPTAPGKRRFELITAKRLREAGL